MTTANSTKTKRKAPPKAWKPGQSGNPNGRPKEGQSWAGVVRDVTDKTADELAEMVGGRTTELGRALLKFPKGVALKNLLVIRTATAIMFEPSGSLLNALMDREEGKPKQTVEAQGTMTVEGLHDLLNKAYADDHDPSA